MTTLQTHGTDRKLETNIRELKLRGLVPNFHIHVSVSDLYIPTMSKIGGLVVGIYKSLTDT
jgi:hypothetical protein